MKNENLKSDEAQDALDSISKMKSAGFRRAIPPRWHGAGMSIIIAIGFALYAMKDPGNTPAMFIVLGVVFFAAFSREKNGVLGKELPDTKLGMWALAGVCVFLLTLFFGGIIVRRTYDIAWVPLLTGFVAGATIFFLSESERRYYQKRATGGES
jgi:hypothetical protein